MWEFFYKESWVLKNWWFWTVVLEKTLESPLNFKEIQPVHPKADQSWVFIGRTNVEAEFQYFGRLMRRTDSFEKSPWCFPWYRERLKVGEGDNRGWDGWMASLTIWTWVWVNSGSWWWTGRPGMLWSMGWQRDGHDWVTELNCTELIRWTFVGKVMSLLFNMLSMLVIAFLSRSKHLWISWLHSPFAVILEPPKIKSATVSTVSPSICHEVMGPDAMIFVFWMFNFKPAFSLCSFTFIKRVIISSSLSAMRVVSFAYLRLLLFLLAILIPACDPSTPAFHMMYSAYKLNILVS